MREVYLAKANANKASALLLKQEAIQQNTRLVWNRFFELPYCFSLGFKERFYRLQPKIPHEFQPGKHPVYITLLYFFTCSNF
jgi:hypothetical protein